MTKAISAQSAFRALALCALVSACSDGPTPVDRILLPPTTLSSTSLAAGTWTTIEGFESGNLNQYTRVGALGATTVSTLTPHDGVYGLRVDGEWIYRADEAVRLSRGDTFSAWIMFDDIVAGRAYLGFGASAAGTLSFVLAPNTGTLIFQENNGFGFRDIGFATQTYLVDRWYRAEVIWGTNGSLVGNLYASDGTTLLRTVTASSSLFTTGGIAFRGFSGVKAFDTYQRLERNSAPVLGSIGNRDATEGSSLSFTATATDPDGNPLTFSLVGAPTGASIDANTGVFQWTPGDGPATATFKVVVSDGTLTDEEEITVTVANAAPVISSLTATTDPIQVVGGTASAAVQVAFSDAAGANDTYSASIQCGDGSTESAAGVTSPHSATCTYSAAGVYTIRATISDEDGGTSAEAVFQYVVVYDPSEGFVTGGGWINSAAGSYAADPTLGGIAKFGFVSRYKKGATVPTGNTEFEFSAGDLYFVSTSYEWLVVAGSRAQFKGDGTINGAGSYKFIVTAIDSRINGSGNADAFRIKITDGSGNVVYDNQMGADEVSGNGTSLGGGNIVIHTK